jgi:hypothetical protein
LAQCIYKNKCARFINIALFLHFFKNSILKDKFHKPVLKHEFKIKKRVALPRVILKDECFKVFYETSFFILFFVICPFTFLDLGIFVAVGNLLILKVKI